MSEAPNRTAAQVGPEAYENDSRPVKPGPADAYFVSLLDPEARKRYEAGQTAEGSGQADA